MLSKSDEEVLDDRLRNWGRWARDRRHVSTNVIYRLMLQAGTLTLGPEQLINPIDFRDAILINRAWQRMPMSPRRYKIAKWLLAMHYIYPCVPLWKRSQILKIR